MDQYIVKIQERILDEKYHEINHNCLMNPYFYCVDNSQLIGCYIIKNTEDCNKDIIALSVNKNRTDNKPETNIKEVYIYVSKKFCEEVDFGYYKSLSGTNGLPIKSTDFRYNHQITFSFNNTEEHMLFSKLRDPIFIDKKVNYLILRLQENACFDVIPIQEGKIIKKSTRLIKFSNSVHSYNKKDPFENVDWGDPSTFNQSAWDQCGD